MSSDMAIITFKETQRKAREHLSDLLDLGKRLALWQVDFIETMAERKEALTPGQIAKIYEIFEQRC